MFLHCLLPKAIKPIEPNSVIAVLNYHLEDYDLKKSLIMRNVGVGLIKT